ncbi:sensor histidine kinase [Labilibacter sediminis]|nr:sensor histidine kinase [Labilibacter sediminis]
MLYRILYCFLLCLFLTTVTLHAEESVINNLHRKLKNASLPEKVEVYNQFSRYYLSSDPEKAIQYANQALKLAQSLNDKKGEAKAYGNLGMGYYFISEYDDLLEYYKKSLSTYKSIGDQKGVAVLATTFYRLDKFQKSIDNYKRSLLLHISENNVEMIISTYQNIGNVYKNLGDYAIALENYSKALDLIPEDTQEYVIEKTTLWGNIGEIWFFLEDYDKALEYYMLLHNELTLREDKQSIAAVLNNMAGVYFFKDDLEHAQKLYSEALALQVEQDDHYGASISYLYLARILFKQNKVAKAVNYHHKSIALAEVINASAILRENYLEMSLIYKSQSNYKKAYEYQVLLSNISDFLAQEQNATQFVNTLAVHDLEKKKQENDMLQAKNENYRLHLEKENLSKWRLSFGFTILVVLILVFIIYYRYYLKGQENRNLELRINEALHKQEEQQQIIVHQASLSSLGELAAGIAHEINQPIQNISLSAEGIKFELEEKEPDQKFVLQSVSEIFEDIVRVREIVDHIRVFSSGQKESVYERFSVSDCVKSAISIISRQYQTHNINLQLKLDDNVKEVIGNPHKVEQVIHNLLSNARDAVDERLAKNEDHLKKICIETGMVVDEVFIEVEDNGVGIPLEKQTDIFLPFVTSKQLGKGTGLGLSISYRLVKEMNGRIEVQSRVMEGTRMRVILPVAPKENNKNIDENPGYIG